MTHINYPRSHQGRISGDETAITDLNHSITFSNEDKGRVAWKELASQDPIYEKRELEESTPWDIVREK